jgi:hypothetical protein
MNSNQNGGIPVKCILVLRFLIYLMYTPNRLQTFHFMQLSPWKNFKFNPGLACFFHFDPSFYICNSTTN